MGQPISIPDNLPSEVAILAKKFNTLLARIDTSREKDRDFFLNLAHEVRTPLAGVRAEIEQALRKPRENDDYRRRLERALEGTEGLNRLVNRLMKFGSLRRKESNLALEQVDIWFLLKRIWKAFEPRAEERSLKIDWRLQDKLEIYSDVELLKIIISNLLENSISYSVEGSSIRVEARATISQASTGMLRRHSSKNNARKPPVLWQKNTRLRASQDWGSRRCFWCTASCCRR